MNRRQFITGFSGLSATTAGCVSDFDSQSTTASSQSPTRTRSQPTRYELSSLSSSYTTDRPPAQHVLYISELYSEADVERAQQQSDSELIVMRVAEIEDSSVREAIETAILDSGWQSEEPPPDGLAGLVEQFDIFRLESERRSTSYFELGLYHLTPEPAIEFDATIISETVQAGDPGSLELELTNRSSTEQRVSGRNIEPFGVVYARATQGGERFLLWSNYEAEECVWIDEDGVEVCFNREPVYLAPGDSISHRYKVLPATTDTYPGQTIPPHPGTYAIGGELQYQDVPTAPRSTLSYEARLTVIRP